MAVLPKNMRELGGDNDWHWPMSGMPAELTLDNGKEFHGLDLEMAAAELNITLNFTPPRQPWHKSQVERKFGEINRSLLAQLPGQVFKYEPEKHGKDHPHLTLEQSQRIFLQWVTTVLHRKPNKEGYTPEELWMDSVNKHGTPGGGLPQDYIFMCLAKTVAEKVIHPDGIHFQNLSFNNEWLSRLRNELSPQAGNDKPKVKIKWSASDVSVIYVLHPKTNQYFEVHAKEEHARGRSLYNHRVVLREQRNRRNARMRDSSYLDAALAVDQSIKSLASKMAKKGKKVGSRLARFEGGKPDKQGRTRTVPPTPPEPFDRDEPIPELPTDIIDMNTGEVIATEPVLKKADPQDNIEDFSQDLEI
jgi:putative transposase